MTLWSYPGSRLVKVVDGDTFVASLTRDVGFHAVITWQQRFRLARINAAPAMTDAGHAAAGYLVGLLAGTFTVDSVGPYKYGDEWMAEVRVANGSNVSDVMVGEGFAIAWDGRGPKPGG